MVLFDHKVTSSPWSVLGDTLKYFTASHLPSKGKGGKKELKRASATRETDTKYK